MKRALLAATATADVMMAQGAWASSPATTTLNVTADVPTVCSITAAPDLSFPAVTSNASAVTTSSAIQVTCTDGGAYTIGVVGANVVGSQNKLVSGSNSLNYNLYSDSGYSTVWDNGSNLVSPTGNGSAQTSTLYAKIPSGQTLHVGTAALSSQYADIVTVTVTY